MKYVSLHCNMVNIKLSMTNIDLIDNNWKLLMTISELIQDGKTRLMKFCVAYQKVDWQYLLFGARHSYLSLINIYLKTPTTTTTIFYHHHQFKRHWEIIQNCTISYIKCLVVNFLNNYSADLSLLLHITALVLCGSIEKHFKIISMDWYTYYAHCIPHTRLLCKRISL